MTFFFSNIYEVIWSHISNKLFVMIINIPNKYSKKKSHISNKYLLS